MDQRYVFFPIKNINWDSTYLHYKNQVTNGMSNPELFSVIGNMLQTLKDGHVSLSCDFDTSTYEGFYELHLPNFNYNNIVNNYLKNDFQSNGPFVFKIAGDLGYIYYGSFDAGFTDTMLDSMLSVMKNTKGLIIDVRNNVGGIVENADKIFQRFLSEKKLVKYEGIKQGKTHDDFSDPIPYYLSPKGYHYSKPICVLTNRKCFSSCNDFVMYMSKLSNVKVIGDTTGGGGGIPAEYILANGWRLQYTATVTLSPLKNFIENGIAPLIAINITSIEEANGIDPILDKAIKLLQ